jgi:hypothetical protein
VVAGHPPVHPPPHPLDWVGVRRVGRQVTQHHPVVAPSLQGTAAPACCPWRYGNRRCHRSDGSRGGGGSTAATRPGARRTAWRCGRPRRSPVSRPLRRSSELALYFLSLVPSVSRRPAGIPPGRAPSGTTAAAACVGRRGGQYCRPRLGSQGR